MGFGNDIGRDVFDELFFRLQWVLAVRRQSEPFAYTEYMRIDRHCGLVPYDRTNDISGFASYSLQRLKVVDVIGYLTVIDGNEALRHLHQVFRFGTGITDRLDIFKDLVTRGFRQSLRCRVGGKEGRRYHIHPFVRTLCRQHHSHKALERIEEHKFALRYRHVRFKPSQYVLKALFGRHDKCDLGR